MSMTHNYLDHSYLYFLKVSSFERVIAGYYAVEDSAAIIVFTNKMILIGSIGILNVLTARPLREK